MHATQPPFPVYTGTDGLPLDAGYLYFGQANQNPETAPITVYLDVAGAIPANTSGFNGGYVYRQTPVVGQPKSWTRVAGV